MDLVEQGIRESGHSLRKSAADSHLNRFDVLWWRRASSWLAILSCCIVGIITVICCVARPESRSLEKSDLRAAIAWSEPEEVSLGAEVGRLVRLDEGHFKHARCLDGSQAAYYWRPGSRATSWLVFLEGGGFCSTWAECVARAATDLGSSKGYKQTMTFTEPYLSLNVSDNPLLHDWGVVYAKYCDGAYFAGRAGEVADPQTGSKLHFAGEHILKAVVEDMASRAKGFRRATEVIVAGCSAGGIAVLNQMDGIKRLFQARLPKAKQIYGFADSGFYLAKPMYIEPKRFVIEAQHGGGLLPPKCLQDHSDSPWLCLVGEVGTQYLQTPVFMWETRYDEDHQMCEMDVACRANATCIETYGQELQRAVLRLAETLPGSGAFVDACPHHCWGGFGQHGYEVWRSPVPFSVGNATPPQALASWYGQLQAMQGKQMLEVPGVASQPLPSKPIWVQQGSYPCVECCAGAGP